jgi:mono/diheme cytochrome c family protein
MRARWPLALAAAWMVSIGAAARQTPEGPAPAATPAPRSAWSGVYNAEQAERGRAVYNAQCARCHGETLGGGENSPALVDDVFFAFWNGKTVGDLVEYTRTMMPSDGPGRIPRRRCVEIAAYLLSANGFPAGDAELPAELEELTRITITRKP